MVAPTELCALQVLEALQRGAAHESLVCCAAYLLGEYGRQVQQVPLRDQFTLLQERFVTVSSEAKVSLPAQLVLTCCSIYDSSCVHVSAAILLPLASSCNGFGAQLHAAVCPTA